MGMIVNTEINFQILLAVHSIGKIFSVKRISEKGMAKKKILIIDDEADFCLLLKSYFSSKQYEVYYSYSLNTGLKLLEEIRPDILFLDNNLPDGSGWNKADQISRSHPEVQVNLISTHLNEYPKSSSSSAFRVWKKPLKLNELSKMF